MVDVIAPEFARAFSSFLAHRFHHRFGLSNQTSWNYDTNETLKETFLCYR
jgi:hypothetical protein